MLNKSPIYNVSAKGIYFLEKVANQISTFGTFHCLSEVFQIPHVIFETRSQFFCIKFAPFCNILAKI